MRSSLLAAAGMLLGTAHGLNILMNNDDGFGSANLREFYKVLKSKGHNGESSRMNFYLPMCPGLTERPLSLDRSARRSAERPRRPFRLHHLSEPHFSGPVWYHPGWCALSWPRPHRQPHLVLQRHTSCLHLRGAGLRPPQLRQLQQARPGCHRTQLRHEPGSLCLDALRHGRRRVRSYLALNSGHRLQRVQQCVGLPQYHQFDQRVHLRRQAFRQHRRCLRQVFVSGGASLASRLWRQCQLPQARRELVSRPYPPDENDWRGKHECCSAGGKQPWNVHLGKHRPVGSWCKRVYQRRLQHDW